MNECRDTRHETICHMITACRKHLSTVDSLASELGCHHSQHRVLVCLTQCGTNPSQKAIADKLKISPAAVAVTLKKLEKSGYIERSTADNDNRINEIRITAEGERLLRMTKRIFETVDDAVCAGISENELRMMCRCFEKMCENLNHLEPETILAVGKEDE